MLRLFALQTNHFHRLRAGHDYFAQQLPVLELLWISFAYEPRGLAAGTSPLRW
jgi:hypothetical protein